jgi:hypothetical protein
MANINNPSGLRPLARTISGGCPTILPYTKLASYGTPLYIFDAVNQVASGDIEVSATPGTTYYTGVNLTYGAANTASTHLVVVSPDAVFVAQSNGNTVAADRGLNANLVLGAGNPDTLVSGHQVNDSTKNTTATLDVKLLDTQPVPNNDYGTYSKWLVVFNKHRFSAGVAGV